MSANSGTPVRLDDFLGHIIRTHLKDNAASVLCEIRRRVRQADLPDELSLLKKCVASSYPDRPSFVDDNWREIDVDLDRCYFAHGDFRGCQVPKDGRFVDFVESQRGNIQLGTFPCSSEIRTPLALPVPPPLVRERVAGKYYVLDGQLRMIKHCYHRVPRATVFMYTGNCPDSK